MIRGAFGSSEGSYRWTCAAPVGAALIGVRLRSGVDPDQPVLADRDL